MSEEPVRPLGLGEDVLRLALPIVVLGLGILVWELVVRLKGIPPYVLPAPSLVFATLVSDWPLLSESLGVTLVTESMLLLMDEPFAALDEITRFKLNDDLLSLWESLRKTVVFVTHSVFESVYLSSRIVVMTPRPGRVFTELAIDAPYPRDQRFRTSAEYGAFCRRASEALAAATDAKTEAKP